MATLRFPPFAVDSTSFTLTRDDVSVPLLPKYVAILATLVSRPGELTSKTALLDEHWAGVAVTENTLAQALVAIRAALGDDPLKPRFIQTVKGKGYRFIGIVDTSGAPPQPNVFDDWVKGRLSLETLNAEELGDATTTFERVEARNPCYAPAHAALANAHFLQYEPTRIESTPDHARLERAIGYAKRAYELDSSSPEAAATLGYLFYAAGKVEQARALLKIATMLRPDIWRHWFRQAVVCWGDERLEAVAQALSRKKDFAPAFFLRAMVFIARQVFDLAEDYAAQGAALQSAHAGLRSEFPAFGLHWLLGLLLLRTGEVKRALASFDREINEGRREHVYFREYRINALLGMGYAHLAAGDAAPAADAFRGALEFLPGSARALLGLGHALAQRGLEEEAAATAKRLQSSLVALTKGGRLMEVALVSAGVDAARGHHKAAAVTLQKLLEQAPPGQTGWMIPIDPALAPLRDHPAFARVCALLSSRAS